MPGISVRVLVVIMLGYLALKSNAVFLYILVGIVLIGVVVGCVYGLYLAVSRFAEPTRHPIYKRLARYDTNTDYVLQGIDSDLQRGSSKIGKLTFSKDWIIQAQANNIDVIRIAEVMWLYMHVHRTKYYGVITVSKVVSAHIWDQHGVCIKSSANEAKVKELLENVVQRAPWAIIGFTPQLQQAWDRDRVGFVREVRERRRQVLEQERN